MNSPVAAYGDEGLPDGATFWNYSAPRFLEAMAVVEDATFDGRSDLVRWMALQVPAFVHKHAQSIVEGVRGRPSRETPLSVLKVTAACLGVGAGGWVVGAVFAHDILKCRKAARRWAKVRGLPAA